MLDHFWTSNEALEFYLDSVGRTGSQRRLGIYFQGKWAQGSWPLDWAKNDILRDIASLELFPVVVAIQLWGDQLKNKMMLFHIDNKSVTILSKKSSKPCRFVSLVRKLILVSLRYNILIKGQYIIGKLNCIADALSRCNWQHFRELAPNADHKHTHIPDHIWKI